MSAYIAYVRVSTKRQGISGLGLEAQREAIRRFLRPEDVLLAEFVEVESGTKRDRPKLQAALLMAHRQKAHLIVARLDRLGRKLSQVASLIETVPVRVCDMPNVDNTLLGLLASVSAIETKLISTRTREALAAARARGTRLGGDRGWRPDAAHQAKANAPRLAAARARAAQLKPILAELPGTLAYQADQLNQRGIPAPRGGLWSPGQVARIHAL